MSIAHKFREMCSLKNLAKVAKDVCRRTVAGIDGIKGRRFIASGANEKIQRILASLKQGGHRFSRYRERLIVRGADREPRVISIPTIKDAIVLRILMKAIHAGFPGGATPMAFVIVRKVVQTLKKGEFGAFVRLDIRNFYPSINHNILLTTLGKKLRNPSIMSIVREAIKTPTVPSGKSGKKIPPKEKGVPQGLSISNILANIYMLEFDRRWKNRQDCAYFRYVDDILIFCRDGEEKKIKEEILAGARDICMEIHDDDSEKSKTGRVAGQGFSYLGYTFRIKHDGKVAVGARKAAMSKIRQSIINILTAYARSDQRNINHLLWCINLRITGCRFDGKWLGWMHYYSQMDISVAIELDKFVRKILRAPRFNVQDGLEVKSFVRVLREVRASSEAGKGKKRDIPDFDDENKWTPEEKRKLLREVFSFKKQVSDEKLDRVFRAKIFRHVKQLQRDMIPNRGGDGEY